MYQSLIKNDEPFSEKLIDSLERIPPEDLSSLLTRYTEHAPLSLALREINRFAVLQKELKPMGVNSDSKILDVGCGDGFWWSLLGSARPKVFGIDISKKELSKTNFLSAIETCDISDENSLRVLQNKAWPVNFDVVIGNCSLEHVLQLDAALHNIAKLTAQGGYFLLFVPTQTWAMQGKSLFFLSKYLPRIAMTISGALNGFFQHWHLMTDKSWCAVLEKQGFTVEKIIYMGNKKSEFLFRLFLPSAYFSYLFKTITGLGYFNPFIPKWVSRQLVSWVVTYLTTNKTPNTPIDYDQKRFSYEYAFVCKKSKI